jgi:hypothetical protein
MSLYYQIKVLCPDIQDHEFSLQNDGKGAYIKTWASSMYIQPTESALKAVEVQADKLMQLTLVRQRRAAKYPSVGDQLGAITDYLRTLNNVSPELATILAQIAQVKLDNPKPE